MKITMQMTSIDNVKITKHYKTVKGANKFVKTWTGHTPINILNKTNGTYWVSDDGVGKVTLINIEDPYN